MFACLLCVAIGSWLLHYALHMTGYLQLCHAPEIACQSQCAYGQPAEVRLSFTC